MAKVGRPREQRVSKWGYWKRNQRAALKRGKRKNRNMIIHHRDGNKGNNKRRNLVMMSRSAHRAVHNRRGRLKTSPGRAR